MSVIFLFSDQHEELSKHLAQTGIKSSVDLLLSMIKGVQRQDRLLLFLNALRESGNTTNALLADFIGGVDQIEDFDIENQLINKFYQELQVIDPIEIAPYLTYISVDDQESLMCKCRMGETNLARTTLLLLTIRTLEPEWFKVFLDALQKTNHGTIAEKLESERQTALASSVNQKANPFLSKSLESLSLKDSDLMDDTTRGQPTVSGESQWDGFQKPSSSRVHRVSFTDSPDSSRPRNQNRSRSVSMKRPCLKSTRKSSCSPKRKRVNEERSKRKRSHSRERLQGAASNNIYFVYAENSTNLTAVMGGENCTINLGHVSKKAARIRPDPGLAGEDQPDHAAMPPEEDIQPGNMDTGDALAPQEGKLLL